MDIQAEKSRAGRTGHGRLAPSVCGNSPSSWLIHAKCRSGPVVPYLRMESHRAAWSRDRVRPPKGAAHEQHRDRYGGVVQAKESLPRSFVIMAPTSRSAKATSFRPEADMAGERTRALVEQVGTVDSNRLGQLVGHLSTKETWDVDEALAAILGHH